MRISCLSFPIYIDVSKHPYASVSTAKSNSRCHTSLTMTDCSLKLQAQISLSYLSCFLSGIWSKQREKQFIPIPTNTHNWFHFLNSAKNPTALLLPFVYSVETDQNFKIHQEGAREMTQQLLCLQRIWVRFPASTWQPTTFCSSSSRESSALSWLAWAPVCMCST